VPILQLSLSGLPEADLYDVGLNFLRPRAGYDAAVATYRETILTAFQQGEDNLAAMRILAREFQQQRQAVADAQESLELFTNRCTGGVDTYPQVITAQTIALKRRAQRRGHSAPPDGR
jgi:outer membrane protein TolC